MRTCADCGAKLLVKDTFREDYSVVTRKRTYRCNDCRRLRVAALVAHTREWLGLTTRAL